MKKINKFFFILLPFIDLITSLSARFIDLPISLGMIIKSLYLIFITIYILFYSKSHHKKTFISYFILIAIYSIIYFITKTDLLKTVYLLNEISSLFKLLYGSILFFAILVIYDELKYNQNDINKLMFYSLITYVILLIIPTITNTNFNSYITKDNAGSIGWFYAANDISSILLILYPFIYIRINNKINKKNKKTYLYYLLIIPIIYSIFIIGTKTSWLGLIILTILLIIIFFINKKDKQNKTYISIVLLIILSITPLSPAFKNINKDTNRTEVKNEIKIKNVTEEKKANLIKEQVCEYHKINEIINKNIYNKIHLLLSGRENKAYTLFLIYKDSNFLNKLFGIGFSNTKRINNCYVEKYIEIDILDIVFHYGIIGLIIILIPFIYLIKNIIKSKTIKETNQLIYLSIIIVSFIISCIAGHVIGYPSVNIYLSIIMLLMIKEEVQQHEKQNQKTH